MASLLEPAWTTNAAAHRADLLEAVVEEAAALVPDGFALIWLASGERLVLGAAAGHLHHAHGGVRLEFVRGVGLVGATALARDLWVVDDPAADARAHETGFLRTEDVRRFIGLPLVAGYALQGVLGVFSRRADWPDAAGREALAALGSRAALAVESARLFADSERRRRAAEALAAVGQALAQSLDPQEVWHLIADSVLALLDARDVIVYRLDASTGTLESMAFAGESAAGIRRPIVLPAGTGVSGRALAEGRPILTADLLTDPRFTHVPEHRARLEQGGYRAVVAAPLLVAGEAIGALSAAAGRGRVFDDEAPALLEAFADQAAVALRNARLFAAERQARAELAGESEVLTLIAAGEPLPRVLERLGRVIDAHDPDLHGSVRLAEEGYLPSARAGEWTVPVLDASGVPLATVVVDCRSARAPRADERVLMARAARLAGIAVERARAEQALRDSEERYRTLITNIPDVVWLTDSRGGMVFVSPHVHRVGGYTAEELYRSGPAGWFARVHPDDLPMVQKQFAALFGGPGRTFDLEYRLQHKDGRWIWIHDRALATYEAHGVTYASGIYTDVTDRKRAEEIRALLLNQVITVQEEERRRIARELHDETAQSLASLLLGLSALREARSLRGVRAAAAELHQVVTRALAEVRRLASGLRPSALDDLGLPDAVARYAADFGTLRGIAIDVDTLGLGPSRMPPAVETALYRIMQEALSNVARHAAARRARVRLERSSALVTMTVSDDGAGFDPGRPPAPATAAHGLGIHTMRERALVLNGTLTIESAPGRGTRVRVEIPLGEAGA